MKILRRHHGFTTNSSASSEWSELTRQFREEAKKKGLNAFPEEAGKQEEPPSQPPPAEAAPAPAPAPPPRSPLVDNALVLGGLILAVLGLFALERLLRRWWRHHQDQADK